PPALEHVFQYARLRVSSIKDGVVAPARITLGHAALDGVRDEARLVQLVVRQVGRKKIAGWVLRPELLVATPAVLADHLMRCFEDALRGAIVLFQLQNLRRRVVVLESENEANI